jgi:hypothetical protein
VHVEMDVQACKLAGCTQRVQHAATFLHSQLQELMDITEKQLVLPLPGYTSMENPIAEETHFMLLPSFRATFN